MKFSRTTAVVGAVLAVSVIFGGLAAANTGMLDDDLRRPGSVEVNEASLPEDDRREQSVLEEKATLDRNEAEAAALESVGGGTVTEAELDEESGFLIWDVEVHFEGIEHEMVVDAGDARILGSDRDRDDDRYDDDRYDDDRYDDDRYDDYDD